MAAGQLYINFEGCSAVAVSANAGSSISAHDDLEKTHPVPNNNIWTIFAVLVTVAARLLLNLRQRQHQRSARYQTCSEVSDWMLSACIDISYGYGSLLSCPVGPSLSLRKRLALLHTHACCQLLLTHSVPSHTCMLLFHLPCCRKCPFSSTDINTQTGNESIRQHSL